MDLLPSADPVRRRMLAAVVVIQFAVPTVALTMDAPTRLGFQMYSGMGEVPVVEVVTREGDVETLRQDKVIAVARAELPWAQFLPPHVCRVYSDAQAVRLRYKAGVRSYSC